MIHLPNSWRDSRGPGRSRVHILFWLMVAGEVSGKSFRKLNAFGRFFLAELPPRIARSRESSACFLSPQSNRAGDMRQTLYTVISVSRSGQAHQCCKIVTSRAMQSSHSPLLDGAWPYVPMRYGERPTRDMRALDGTCNRGHPNPSSCSDRAVDSD
jgi:hypothetical protein